ncbi:MAG: hypothetical protein KJ899_11880, partial [Gammaproteobacteria bacterium]|nr:hypothetical protein [Gammaproteobacteria bacterium]
IGMDTRRDALAPCGQRVRELRGNTCSICSWLHSLKIWSLLKTRGDSHSRYEHDKPYEVKFDEHWIAEDTDWHLRYSESTKNLSPFTTIIELNRLRVHITSAELAELKTHLREVYAKFLVRGATIYVNGDELTAIEFDDEWSYPPSLFPTQFSISVPIENRIVEAEILSGLINHPGDPDKSYGVFLYCNNRLIARALTDFAVGFSAGLVGNPHYNISLVRTIVQIKGQSRDMPWDSSKSGINTRHPVFQALRQAIIDATKRYSQVSRSLQGKWDAAVFPYNTGHIVQEQMDAIKGIPRSYLPTPPASKLRRHQKIVAANKSVITEKPWAAGLLDSVLAADTVSKLALVQKNRIALIILDSTVEIAYKEYLVNESGIGARRFKEIADNRADVQQEITKHEKIDAGDIKKINHFYKLRCDLIHQRATPNVLDAQIEDYRNIVEKLLKVLFGIDLS